MQRVSETSRLSVGQKLALAGGLSTVALTAGSTATAGMIAAQNTPVQAPTSQGEGSYHTPWDIDGDGTTDMVLINSVSSTVFSTQGQVFQYATTYGAIQLFGNALAAKDGAFAKLNSGDTIPGESFSALGGITQFSLNGELFPVADYNGWQNGDTGFFGFIFQSSGQSYAGWGEATFTGIPGRGFKILRAYYSDTPGTDITVGDTGENTVVPEPSTYALALLAAGGVAAYRKRRHTVQA